MLIERTPTQGRDPHGAKIVGADDAINGQRQVDIGHGWASLNSEAEAYPVERKWEKRDHARRLDAWQTFHAPEHFIVEGPSLLRRRILCAWQNCSHRQQVIGLESEINLTKLLEAPQQQS